MVATGKYELDAISNFIPFLLFFINYVRKFDKIGLGPWSLFHRKAKLEINLTTSESRCGELSLSIARCRLSSVYTDSVTQHFFNHQNT